MKIAAVVQKVKVIDVDGFVGQLTSALPDPSFEFDDGDLTGGTGAEDVEFDFGLEYMVKVDLGLKVNGSFKRYGGFNEPPHTEMYYSMEVEDLVCWYDGEEVILENANEITGKINQLFQDCHDCS